MIIPFFIMNQGCKHRCRFCNERLTAGNHPKRIEAGAFQDRVRSFLATCRQGQGPVQIAFYGGTFTALPDPEQERLLALAAPFLKSGVVSGIRLSTRPDALDAKGIALLKTGGVTTVEVGAQSMDDAVLQKVERGHGTEETRWAVKALREAGIETGMHLMAGLPGDSLERFSATIEKAVDLRPDTVRIHPTLVLRDTALAKDFQQGRYQPLRLEEAVLWCRWALQRFSTAGISVIRLGLQTTAELEAPGAILAGPFHPAFRSLVEGSLFQEMALSLLSRWTGGAVPEQGGESLFFTVAPADLSHFLGLGRRNLVALKRCFPSLHLRVVGDPLLPRGTLNLTAGSWRMHSDFASLSRPDAC